MLSSYLFSTMVFVYSLQPLSNQTIYRYSHFQSRNNFACFRDSIPHPDWDDHSVYLFRPEEICQKYPVVFFCHGITAEDPDQYASFIRHIVSRGYAVVYAPYNSSNAYLFPRCIFRSMWNGFQKGVAVWEEVLDLSNIGFVGHSYGGGAVPSLARKAIVEKGWGNESAFLHIMAPWYIHGITQRQLRHFPKQVKMVAEVFADDKINDHRIAKDLYLSIGIPDSSKVFCTLKGGAGRMGEACHDVPVGVSTFSLEVNDFDYCGVYFIFDALVSYTGNSHAGIARFRHEDMTYSLAGPSGNRCLIVTERKPEMVSTQEICINFWEHSMNPRRNVYRYISAPLRLLITTPETVLMYGMLGLSVLNEAMFKN